MCFWGSACPASNCEKQSTSIILFALLVGHCSSSLSAEMTIFILNSSLAICLPHPLCVTYLLPFDSWFHRFTLIKWGNVGRTFWRLYHYCVFLWYRVFCASQLCVIEFLSLLVYEGGWWLYINSIESQIL